MLNFRNIKKLFKSISFTFRGFLEQTASVLSEDKDALISAENYLTDEF